ncbi:MAG TPA: hypothetical protein VG222_15760 [Vicinamibacterales bacterium]|jgi:hypothetical protein|nr:hypothetical protein [Vicinamibacterales bacterium]
MRQLRHAVRSLHRTPGFAITAVMTIALGVGAATTMPGAIRSKRFERNRNREARHRS